MDAFEQRFAATLQEIARRAPEEPVPALPPPTPRASTRDRLLTPLLAAAAATAILTIGVWQAELGGSETRDDPLAPAAGPGADSPSQAADEPPASRDAVIEVAEQLTALSGKPGFGKVEVDYETATITVFWVGTPPTEASSLEGKHPNGVLVLLESATHSQTELLDASNAAMQAGRARFGQEAIAEVHPNADLSGLVVEATTERVTAEALADTTGQIPLTVRLVDVADVTCAYGQDCQVQTED